MSETTRTPGAGPAGAAPAGAQAGAEGKAPGAAREAARQAVMKRRAEERALEKEAATRWSARSYMLIGLLVSCGLFFGVGVWSASAMIAGAVIASGELRVETKRQTIQHLDGGVVTDILVKDGQEVRAGEVLMRLDRTAIAANVEIVEGQLDELLAREARLDSERLGKEELEAAPEVLARADRRAQAARMLEGQRTLFEARRETLLSQLSQLRGRIEQTKNEIGGGQAQLESLDTQLLLIRDQLVDMRKLLDRGLIQKPQVIAVERDEARLAGDRGRVLSDIARAEGRISELELRILEIEADRRERAITELRDVGVRVAELRERRTALAEQLSRTDIRAPQDGVILDLSMNTVGGVVTPAEPVMYIVPEDKNLIVEARIETLSRDQVHLDQAATVLFPAFNQRTTPELNGLVTSIGADALIDERSGLPYFMIQVRLPEAELERLRAAIDTELVPGLPAEVHVQTDSRSAASYFLKPLMDQFERAMREE